MSKTQEKTNSRKQQLNRLFSCLKPKANQRKFRWRNVLVGTIFGTGISLGFFNIPLECPKVYLEVNYEPNAVQVHIQIGLTLKEARYCEASSPRDSEAD